MISSLVWAFSYGLIKGNLTQLSPDFVAFSRLIIPFLLFFPLLKVKNLSFKKIFLFLSIGAVQYGVMYLCVIRSYQYLSAYQVVFFTAFTPIYVVLIDDVFTRSFKPFYLLTSLLAFLGVGLLYYQGVSLSQVWEGFILVQFSDLCFAFGQVAYKRLRMQEGKMKDENIYALLFLGGALITGVSTTAFGGWSSISFLSFKQMWLLIYLGLIASGLCFFFWNKAAVKTPSGTLAIFNNVKIPLGVLVSIVFFGEEASRVPLLISLFLIGLALFLSESYARKKSVYALVKNSK